VDDTWLDVEQAHGRCATLAHWWSSAPLFSNSVHPTSFRDGRVTPFFYTKAMFSSAFRLLPGLDSSSLLSLSSARNYRPANLSGLRFMIYALISELLVPANPFVEARSSIQAPVFLPSNFRKQADEPPFHRTRSLVPSTQSYLLPLALNQHYTHSFQHIVLLSAHLFHAPHPIVPYTTSSQLATTFLTNTRLPILSTLERTMDVCCTAWNYFISFDSYVCRVMRVRLDSWII